MKEGIRRGIDRKVESGEGNEVSEENTSGILIVGDAEDMRVYYIDFYREYWHEITQKKLDEEGVRKARLEEMGQIHQHKVYTKVPERVCREDVHRGDR